MRKTSLFHEFLIVENAPPGGGVPRVTLPSEPVLPAQIATPPAPILPTPGATIMNGGGHGTDEFQFDQMFLGTPGSPQEALELLGFGPFGSNGSSVTTFPGGGTVHFCSRADGTVVQVRQDDIPINQRLFDMFVDSVC